MTEFHTLYNCVDEGIPVSLVIDGHGHVLYGEAMGAAMIEHLAQEFSFPEKWPADQQARLRAVVETGIHAILRDAESREGYVRVAFHPPAVDDDKERPVEYFALDGGLSAEAEGYCECLYFETRCTADDAFARLCTIIAWDEAAFAQLMEDFDEATRLHVHPEKKETVQ